MRDEDSGVDRGGEFSVCLGNVPGMISILPWLLLAAAQQSPPAETTPATPAPVEEVRGLKLNAEGAFDGYTIIAPINSKQVHLVDMDGEVVHTWETAYAPGAWLYLLDNGNLLRCARVEEDTRFHGGGIGGLLQELDWDGNVEWEYKLATNELMLHHEIDPLPNGNILLIAWEYHSREEAILHGRDEAFAVAEGLWTDVVLELKPLLGGGEIVWTWRAWDHLVQDRDPAKRGYGALRDHPGRIDVNADHRYEDEEESDEERRKREELEEEMRALGYTGGDDPDEASAPGQPAPRQPSGDFLHTNAVDYLPGEDLIVLSTPHLCELWVIDHSTTTEEAAGSTGGKRGRGGELLWRWGNPQNYGHGAKADRRLFYQHDPTWITGERAGELRLLVFNNGGERPEGDYSSVDELVLPFDAKKGFTRESGKAFGPAAPVWSYSDGERFFSAFISGAQRLPNGNTLVCAGASGRVFEVTRDGTVVWDYLNPLGGEIEPSPRGGKAPPKALFRAVRVPRDHPALEGRL